MTSKIIVIDYGSQVTQLIARRIREAGVYSEILPCSVSRQKLRESTPDAIILSGGPASVMDPQAPAFDPEILSLGKPVLGICYGMHLLAQYLGGKLSQAQTREYGPAQLNMVAPSPLWHDLDRRQPSQVWMSHGDTVIELPQGFEIIGSTQNVPIAAMADSKRQIYGLQFHPEVHHSADGRIMLNNFIFEVAKIKPDWNMATFAQDCIAKIKSSYPDGNVICALSGGIDSTVTAVLLNKAIGKRLHCIFVDNGLLRQNEAQYVPDMLRKNFELNLVVVHAASRFLERLEDVNDPEQKRKIIGHTFIEIFQEEAAKIENVRYLAQGTLYPDVIESVEAKGPSSLIKSHHNVGGLPENMKLQLIEPLRELFKDEVRKIALELAIPETIVWRQPFPGPGLAIRVLGPVSEPRLKILRHTDKIIQEELEFAGWAHKIWQGFAVLLPLQTVGVMGDARTYENVIAFRCVDSLDAMTADWTRLPYEILAKISGRIINEVKGINRVVYDISSKPPSTIEWE